MKKINYSKILLIVLLFLIAFLEAVFISLPITLIFVIILAFYWEEEIFFWAFAIGLWQDLVSWHHLGSWSIIFLLTSLLVITIKHRILGLETGQLSLPK